MQGRIQAFLLQKRPAPARESRATPLTAALFTTMPEGLRGKHGGSPGPTPSSAAGSGARRQPTFLLNSVGHGFLDSSGPHDGRVRVGIIRHGHCNKHDPQGAAFSLSVPRRPGRHPSPSPGLSPPAPRSPRPEQASWARNLSRFPRLGMAAGSGRGRPSGPGPRAMFRAPEPAPGATGQRPPAPWPSRAAGRRSRDDSVRALRRTGATSSLDANQRPPWRRHHAAPKAGPALVRVLREVAAVGQFCCCSRC